MNPYRDQELVHLLLLRQQIIAWQQSIARWNQAHPDEAVTVAEMDPEGLMDTIAADIAWRLELESALSRKEAT